MFVCTSGQVGTNQFRTAATLLQEQNTDPTAERSVSGTSLQELGIARGCCFDVCCMVSILS